MREGQTKRGSVVETLTNTALGYFISLLSQLAIFPMFGIHIPLRDNVAIGLWFTVISIVRGYTLRRVFNAMRQRV